MAHSMFMDRWYAIAELFRFRHLTVTFLAAPSASRGGGPAQEVSIVRHCWLPAAGWSSQLLEAPGDAKAEPLAPAIETQMLCPLIAHRYQTLNRDMVLAHKVHSHNPWAMPG